MPQDPEALFFAGDIYMQLHQYPNAIEILQKLILLSEDRFKPRAHFYLGLLFARQGFYLKSLDLLKKCIDFKEFQENSSANHIALLNNLALVQFHLGNYPEAEKIFVNLTDGDVPVSPVVWINLAQIYWIQDKVEESEKALTTANEMDLNSWPWMNRARFLSGIRSQGFKRIDGQFETNKLKGAKYCALSWLHCTKSLSICRSCYSALSRCIQYRSCGFRRRFMLSRSRSLPIV